MGGAPRVAVGLLAFSAAAAAATAANRGILHLVGDRDTTSVLPAGDVDTFVFDAPRGAALTAKVKAAKGVSLLPTLAFVRPDGTPVPDPVLAAAAYAPGKSAAQVKSLAMDQSGRWAVKVSNLGPNQSGEFTLQTRMKYPKGLKVKGAVLPVNGTLEVPFAAGVGAQVSLKLKRKSGGTGLSAPTLRQPSGSAVPVPGTLWTVSDKGISGKGIEIPSGFGDFTMTLPGPTSGEDAVVDFALKVAWPKRKGTAHTISSAEPVVDLITPASGNFGTSIQVIGNDFQEGASLEVGGFPATNVVRSLGGTVLTGIVPAGSGTVAVTVLNPDGQETSVASAFTYIPPPVVSSVSPTSGPATGGTPVTITGANFRLGARVYFGGRAVTGTVTVASATTITLTTEAAPSGLYSVEVRDPSGQSGSLPGAYTFTRLFTRRSGSFPGGLAATSRATVAALGDLDKDFGGVDDIVLSREALEPDGAGAYLPATRVFRGNNNLTFADATANSFPKPFFPTITSGIGTGVSNLDYGLAEGSALGDLDGDGDQDLVLTANGYFFTNTTFTFLCQGYPVYAPYQSSTYYELRYPGTRVLRNNGSGVFYGTSIMYSPSSGFSMALPVLSQGILVGEFFQGRAVALGDMDNDGDLDLVLVGSGAITGVQLLTDCSLQAFANPALRVLANDGSGKFLFDTSTLSIIGWSLPPAGGESFQGRAVAVADLDANGRRDIVVVDDLAPEDGFGGKLFATRVLLNIGTGFTPSPSSLPPATGIDDGRGRALAVVDLTGDGKPDIVVATPEPLEFVDPDNGSLATKSSTRIFRNDGSGSFSETTSLALPAIDGYERWQADGLAVADLDKDGDPDLVLVRDAAMPDGAGGYLPSFRVLLNNGSGTFARPPEGFLPAVDLDPPTNASPSFLQGRWVLLGDLDTDGDRDAVFGTGAPVTGVPQPGSSAPGIEVLENR